MKRVLTVSNRLFALLLCFALTLSCVVVANAAEKSNLLTFDDVSTPEEANLGAGGGLNMGDISIDDSVYFGDSGKSVLVSNRKNLYHRVKINDAFKGMDVKPGEEYTISLWAKVNDQSPVAKGEFFLSVITFEGQVTADQKYYNDKDVHNTRVAINKNAWTQIVLPYTVGDTGVYGISVEQIGSGSVVPMFNFDNVEVRSGNIPAAEPVPVTPGTTTPGQPDTTVPSGTGTRNYFSFNDISSPSDLNLGAGGGYDTKSVTLDSDVFYGEKGKSLKLNDREFAYSRIKFNDAFTGLDMTPGTLYNISMWVRIADESPIDVGNFYISVITFEGQVTEGKSYYNQKDTYLATVSKGGWTQVTLPFTVSEPVYGIALDQLELKGEEPVDYVVTDLYIDDVEVVKADTPVAPPEEVTIVAPVSDVIRVYINDERIIFGDVDPILQNDRTLVPMRKVFEKLGAVVGWDDATQTVTGIKGDRTISLTIGQSAATVNGESVLLDVPACIVDDRTLVPIRFISESLGAVVNWDEAKNTVYIDMESDNSITFDKSLVQQEIWGFGASANNPADDLMKLESESAKNEILDELFGTEGSNAGLSIVRLEINPFTKDAPKEFDALQATIEPEKGVWDFDTDQHQRWFADEAIKRSDDMQFAGSVWSPPGWMKENLPGNANHSGGDPIYGGILKPEHYGDYAEYLKVWAEKYRNDYGYDVKWISVQNEPAEKKLDMPWAGTSYSFEAMDAVLSTTIDVFQEANLPVLIGGPECSGLDASMQYLDNLSPETLEKLGFVAVHFYGGYDVERYDLEQYNKPIFQMEYCNTGKNDSSIDNGLVIAKQISTALNNGYNSYLYWWCVNKMGGETPSTGQSLIDFNADGYYLANKRLYTMGQYSRFIRPGYQLVQSASGNSNLIVTTAIDPATGKVSVVVVNNSSNAIEANINGFTSNTAEVYRTSETENIAHIGAVSPADGQLVYSFAPKSVTTIVEQ